MKVELHKQIQKYQQILNQNRHFYVQNVTKESENSSVRRVFTITRGLGPISDLKVFEKIKSADVLYSGLTRVEPATCIRDSPKQS